MPMTIGIANANTDVFVDCFSFFYVFFFFFFFCMSLTILSFAFEHWCWYRCSISMLAHLVNRNECFVRLNISISIHCACNDIDDYVIVFVIFLLLLLCFLFFCCAESLFFFPTYSVLLILCVLRKYYGCVSEKKFIFNVLREHFEFAFVSKLIFASKWTG